MAPRHPPNALFTLDLHISLNPSHTGTKPRTQQTRSIQVLPQSHLHDKLEPAAKNKTAVIPMSSTCLALASARRASAGQPPFQGSAPSRHSLGDGGWWSRSGSNRRPPACKAGALPAELRPRSGAGLPIKATLTTEGKGVISTSRIPPGDKTAFGPFYGGPGKT